MRYFFRQYIPPFQRVLVVESGSRGLLEDLLPGLYEIHQTMRLDLVTCYPGFPHGFRTDRGEVFRVGDYPDPAARRAFFRQLRARRYDVVGMICSAEPIMTKWKWALAVRLPAKVFVLNENGDYFWLDITHGSTIRHFVLFRAGLSGAGAVPALARLALFPVTVGYLLLYAAAVHIRRWSRRGWRQIHRSFRGEAVL